MMKEKQKIGLVIAYYKNHNNYGTALQGYATLKSVSDLGFTCRIIKYVKRAPLIKKLRLAPLMLISGGWDAYKRKKNKEKISFSSTDYAKNIAIRTKANNNWKDSIMEPYCDTYIGYESLHIGSKDYNLVLVGSDQVWTPLGLYSKFFNLLFVDDSVPRISYASSFGVSKIPWWQKHATTKYLNRIDALSVRELKAKEIVDNLTIKKAVVVLDPTLLRTKEQWEKEFEGKANKVKGDYIFCYLLGKRDETRKEVNKLAKATNLKVVAIRHTDEFIESDEYFGDIAPYDVNPIEFIQLISNAKYVYTDSFHCSVFSIIFQRQFITFYRFATTDGNSRNSRIDSLLSLMGLTSRLYKNEIVKQIQNPIDYKVVERILEALRKDSMEFLMKGLSLAK